MKNKILNLVALSLCLCANTAVMAERFPDVPKSHWAYTAVEDLASKGIYEGYPSTELKGDQPANRYEFALITARCLSYCEQHKDEVNPEEMKKVQDLCIEFADELATMGVRIDDDEYGIIALRGDVSELKKEVQEVKDQLGAGAKKSKFGNLRLSGDILVHNHNLHVDDTFSENKTRTNLRLQLDADINDKVSMSARWRVIDGIQDSFYGAGDWNGSNKGTSSVEIANMKVKNFLGFDGEFKLGRDWHSHGHGLIVNNYMDAISYGKRCGDVDLTVNCFFNRYNSEADKDYYNIWNINADTDCNGHKLYLGLYDNHVERSYSSESFNEFRMEFGSSGKLSKKNDKLSYDLAGVYTDTESTGSIVSTDPVKLKDEKGWLGHVAFNYDSQKQLTAKIAYTMADDGSNADTFFPIEDNYSTRQDFNSWHEGKESIFEDIAMFARPSSFGGVINSNGYNFKNLSDLKLQVGYTLKDYDRHSFRLAYDMVKSDKDDINGFYSETNTNSSYHKVDFDMITAEYRYRISPNTRFRMVYSMVKDDSQEVAGGPTSKDQNMFYSEIYSRF